MAASSSLVLVPPLSDRSNALDASISPRTPSDFASITPIPSKKHLFPHLDSSEATPSENSSIYDARSASSDACPPSQKKAKRRSKSQSKSWTDEQRPRSGTPNPPGVAVRFINRPHGSPLTTILEQKSLATLRSKKSLLATSRAGNQKNVSGDKPSSLRLVSMTVDEATLRELHQIIDAQTPWHPKGTQASECVNDVNDPTRPVSPPHAPYERTSTPCGVPRWPGDLPTSSRSPEVPRQRVSRARSVGNALRDFLRGPREAGDCAMRLDRDGRQRRTNQPHPTGRAYWAPPRSGHGSTGRTGAPRGCATGVAYPAETSFETSPPRDPQTDRQPNNGEAQAQQQDTQKDRVQHRHGGQPPRPPPPDVAHPSLQASRHTSTSENRTSQGSSGSGRRPCVHSLIPEPLFTSPPHSRRNLDPRVPDSPYDRVPCMVGGRSADMPSHSHTTSGHTAVDTPRWLAEDESARSFDICCNEGHRIVSVNAAVTNRPRSGAFSSPGPPRHSSPPGTTPRTTCNGTVDDLEDPAGDSRSSVTFPITQKTPRYFLFPRSTLPLASPSNLPRAVPLRPLNPRAENPCPVETPATHVIRSAALPALIPLAVSNGLSSRQRPLPRPVSSSSLRSISSSMARPVHASRRRQSEHRSRSLAATRGSGDGQQSPLPAAQSSHVRANQSAPARRSLFVPQYELAPPGAAQRRVDQGVVDTQRHYPHRISCKKGSSDDDGFEKRGTWGSNFGWLMRVCFCQPFDPTGDAMMTAAAMQEPVGLMEMNRDDADARQQ